jgi:adenylate cyclase
MPRETDSLAILFADIAKSTHLYEKLGNTVAQNLIATCLTLFEKVANYFEGSVIKTIGDEIMCTFPTAQNAVEAAIEMNESLEEMPLPEGFTAAPPNIYVGIQYGNVIKEDGDVFGDAVNVAARMVAQAKQRQIITTRETVNQLDQDLKDSASCIDKTIVKGKSGEMSIFEIVWEQHDVTVMMDDAIDSPALRCRMELSVGATMLEMDESRPSATLGRQLHNDVVVKDKGVSRSHARIEYNRGKFILIDQSTNGTFVLLQGKKRVHLRRDETALLGNGIISLGKEIVGEADTHIKYVIKM